MEQPSSSTPGGGGGGYSSSSSTAAGSGIAQPNLNFDQLKQRMDAFQGRFDDYISRDRQKITDSRNELTKTISEHKETQKAILAEIEELKQKEAELSKARARDQKELEESRSAIATYTSKRGEMIEANNQLQEQISTVRQSIQDVRDEQAKKKQSLNSQTILNGPELDFWERTLGLRIEGADDEDFIKFVFTQIDPNDGDGEYSITLDLTEHDYAVSKCDPQVDQTGLKAALDNLNENRRLNVFLRDIRRLFKQK